MAATAEPLTEVIASPHNRDQERIVRYLAEQVRRELAGETHDFIERTWPHRKLQLGVLPPLPPPEDDDEHAETDEPADDDAGEKGAAARAEPGRPPSTMAIEFLFNSVDDIATIEVEADFSVYIQRYPSREQQAEYWSRTAAGETNMEGEPVETLD